MPEPVGSAGPGGLPGLRSSPHQTNPNRPKPWFGKITCKLPRTSHAVVVAATAHVSSLVHVCQLVTFWMRQLFQERMYSRHQASRRKAWGIFSSESQEANKDTATPTAKPQVDLSRTSHVSKRSSKRASPRNLHAPLVPPISLTHPPVCMHIPKPK